MRLLTGILTAVLMLAQLMPALAGKAVPPPLPAVRLSFPPGRRVAATAAGTGRSHRAVRNPPASRPAAGVDRGTGVVAPARTCRGPPALPRVPAPAGAADTDGGSPGRGLGDAHLARAGQRLHLALVAPADSTGREHHRAHGAHRPFHARPSPERRCGRRQRHPAAAGPPPPRRRPPANARAPPRQEWGRGRGGGDRTRTLGRKGTQ